MKKFFILLFSAAILMAAGCERPEPEPEPEPEPVVLDFAKGADVSWLTQMEQEGCRFYTAKGQEMECMALLKSLGVNAIRLRVWVDPKDGWCGKSGQAEQPGCLERPVVPGACAGRRGSYLRCADRPA